MLVDTLHCAPAASAQVHSYTWTEKSSLNSKSKAMLNNLPLLKLATQHLHLVLFPFIAIFAVEGCRLQKLRGVVDTVT
jgi:hypothetical protein